MPGTLSRRKRLEITEPGESRVGRQRQDRANGKTEGGANNMVYRGGFGFIQKAVSICTHSIESPVGAETRPGARDFVRQDEGS